jgi:DNA polymerase-3 subunit epsilon
MNFIAIDFEIANKDRGSICAMGVAVVEKGKLIEKEGLLIKPTPNRYTWPYIGIHGINDAQTQHLKTFKQQWKDLKPYLHNQKIVFHNAPFDCSALLTALDNHQLSYPNTDYYCTYRLSKALLNLDKHKLDVVSKHFKIKLKHHDAKSDAAAAAQIALRLCDKYKASSLEELSESLGFKAGRILSRGRLHEPFSKMRFHL